ncbi:WD repeat protein-like protein [Xylogone sp. PMI_703]|nr:WD repeat protein-like protein [Xylogone sp. PMI_703]
MNKGKIMRKLLGQHLDNEILDSSLVDSPQLRPNASQNTAFSADAPIVSLDRSPDGQHAVLAGPKVFKTIRIDGSSITQDVDLRAVLSSFTTSGDVSAGTVDQFNIRTVKWSHSMLDTTIITGGSNGRITVYDLNRIGDGLEVARILDHSRQVHKLAINPNKCNWLLSASHDGTVKSYDIRMPPVNGRSGPIFRTWQTFKCNADAVRDVQWSPADGTEFACSTDSGVIQKWDFRKPTAPYLKFAAHQSPCFSIEWHPDGEHLISGGLDQHVHVWDFSKKAERGQKPKWSLTTPAPVSMVSWRPATWSATAHGQRSAQLAVCYDDTNAAKPQNASVQIWDLARPTMPFKEMHHWDSSPTGLLWNSKDLLWTVDREGYFTQTDVAFAPRVLDRRSVSTMAFSSRGDALMLLEERQPPQRLRPSVSQADVSPSYSHSPNGQLLSVSRSDSEEDVAGSFLGLRRVRAHRRRNSARINQGISSTPPAALSFTEQKPMSLDETIKITGIFKSQQIMAIGHLPSTPKQAIYHYLSNHYLERISRDISPSLEPPSIRLASTLEYFGVTAQAVGHYRLAQTWRLLGYTINLLLVRRAEYHRKARLDQDKESANSEKQKEIAKEKERPKRSPSLLDRGEDTPRRLPSSRTPVDSPIHRAARAIISEELESTSNVATPLVRPVLDSIVEQAAEAMRTPLIEQDEFSLPPPVVSNVPTPIPVPRSESPEKPPPPIVGGYDFYGIESSPLATEFIVPQRKLPLTLNYPKKNDIPSRMQVARHDSNESFQMFSSSVESNGTRFMPASARDSFSEPHLSRKSSDANASSWESAYPSHLRRELSSSDLSGGTSQNSTGKSKDPPSPPTFNIQEASEPAQDSVFAVREPSEDSRKDTSILENKPTNPEIIDEDFMPWDDDPEFLPAPIDPCKIVLQSINFETLSGCLNASIMILLLQPYLPPNTVDKIQSTAILKQYHQRLTTMKLFNEAAMLRNLCVPHYPSIFGAAQERVTIGYFCTNCQKPLENDPLIPGSEWFCPRCRQAIDGCAVCRHREVDGDLDYGDDSSVELALWWLCPGCGHGGHTTCMQAWHAGPELQEGSMHSSGSCPLEGCLHPCLPGTWRDQRADERQALKQKELDKLVKESNSRQSSNRSSKGVRRDAKEANQSKAVEGVRVALGVSGAQYPGVERKRSLKGRSA